VSEIEREKLERARRAVLAAALGPEERERLRGAAGVVVALEEFVAELGRDLARTPLPELARRAEESASLTMTWRERPLEPAATPTVPPNPPDAPAEAPPWVPAEECAFAPALAPFATPDPPRVSAGTAPVAERKSAPVSSDECDSVDATHVCEGAVETIRCTVSGCAWTARRCAVHRARGRAAMALSQHLRFGHPKGAKVLATKPTRQAGPTTTKGAPKASVKPSELGEAPPVAPRKLYRCRGLVNRQLCGALIWGRQLEEHAVEVHGLKAPSAQAVRALFEDKPVDR
jgi:hypothetical protein